MSAGSYSFVPSPWRNNGGVITPAAGATQVLVPEGTAALPGLAVVGRTGTGLRIRVADEVHYSANGVYIGQIDVAGSRQVRCRTTSAGTAGDPAFSLISTLDGMYFPADNRVAIGAGGVQQAEWDAAALAAQTTAQLLRMDQGAGSVFVRINRDAATGALENP